MVDKEKSFIYSILSIILIVSLIPILAFPFSNSGLFIQINKVQLYHKNYFSGCNNSFYFNTSVNLKEIDLYIDNNFIDYFIEKDHNRYYLSEIDVSKYKDGFYSFKVYIQDEYNSHYEFISFINIDNKPPIIDKVKFPNNSICYDNKENIIFEARIIDFSLTETILNIKKDNDFYYSLNFSNSNIISYQQIFDSGNYTYSIKSKDLVFFQTILNGSFSVINNSLSKIESQKIINIFEISYPRSTKESGYNIIFNTIFYNITNEFKYKIYNFDYSILIHSGKLENNTLEYAYLNIFDEPLIIQVFNFDKQIYNLEIQVEFLGNITNKKTIFNIDILFLLVSLIGLIFTISTFIYKLRKDNKKSLLEI